MTVKDAIQKIRHGGRQYEFVRFCIVGGLATAIHYGVYALLQMLADSGVWLNVAYTAGYAISLVCNFFLTTYFTFRSKASTGKVAGFGFSHLVNYSLHIVLLNIFLSIGVHRLLAPAFVLMVAVPTNFTILHFVYKNKSDKQ